MDHCGFRHICGTNEIPHGGPHCQASVFKFSHTLYMGCAACTRTERGKHLLPFWLNGVCPRCACHSCPKASKVGIKSTFSRHLQERQPFQNDIREAPCLHPASFLLCNYFIKQPAMTCARQPALPSPILLVLGHGIKNGITEKQKKESTARNKRFPGSVPQVDI